MPTSAADQFGVLPFEYQLRSGGAQVDTALLPALIQLTSQQQGRLPWGCKVAIRPSAGTSANRSPLAVHLPLSGSTCAGPLRTAWLLGADGVTVMNRNISGCWDAGTQTME